MSSKILTIKNKVNINSGIRSFLSQLSLIQVHAQSRTRWKYNKNECRFWYDRYFTEKQDVLIWRNTPPRQVKNYIDNNLNPTDRSNQR